MASIEPRNMRFETLAALDTLTKNISKKSVDDITSVIRNLLQEIHSGGLHSFSPSEIKDMQRDITIVSSSLKERLSIPKELIGQIHELQHLFQDVSYDLKFRLKGSEEEFSVNSALLQHQCPHIYQFFEMVQIPSGEIPELDLSYIEPHELRIALEALTGSLDLEQIPDYQSIARYNDVANYLGAESLATQCDTILAKRFVAQFQNVNLSQELKVKLFEEIRKTLAGRFEALPIACEAVGKSLPTFFGAMLSDRLATKGLDKAELSKEELAEALSIIHKTIEEVLPFGVTQLIDFSCIVSLIKIIANDTVRTSLFKHIFDNVPECDALLAERLAVPLARDNLSIEHVMTFLHHFGLVDVESFEKFPEAKKIVQLTSIYLIERMLNPTNRLANDLPVAAQALSHVRHIVEIAQSWNITGRLHLFRTLSDFTGESLLKTALKCVFDNDPQVLEEIGKLVAIIKKTMLLSLGESLFLLEELALDAGFNLRQRDYSIDEEVRALSFLTRGCRTLMPLGIKLQGVDSDLWRLVSPKFADDLVEHLRDERVLTALTTLVETLHQVDPTGGHLPTLIALYKLDKNRLEKAKELLEAELAKVPSPKEAFHLNLYMAELLMTGEEDEIDPERAVSFAKRGIEDAHDPHEINRFKPGVALVFHKAGKSDEALALLDVNDPLQCMMSLFLRKLRGEAFSNDDLPQMPQGRLTPWEETIWLMMENVILGKYLRVVNDAWRKSMNQTLDYYLSKKSMPLVSLQFKEVLAQYPKNVRAKYLNACPDLKLLV